MLPQREASGSYAAAQPLTSDNMVMCRRIEGCVGGGRKRMSEAGPTYTGHTRDLGLRQPSTVHYFHRDHQRSSAYLGVIGSFERVAYPI